MKIEVTVSDFIAAFQGRDGWSDDYSRHFSYRGLLALFDYLEELDSEMVLDRAEIACEFTEYKSLEAFNLAVVGEKYRNEFYNLRNLEDGEPSDTILVEQKPSATGYSNGTYSVIWNHGNQIC